MELREKEAQKDYNIQEICLERTYRSKMSVNSRLRATKIIGKVKGKHSIAREFQNLAAQGKKLLT